ncbi:MAG: guanine deaminase [Gammaproteobacteria bacterium RIFCSPHIGHO2_12_FULL_41_20]|nr:MAG: guanine deaminase [Gammaproteobacteria bacterium RIFCSPHIGHO2_12_FULL_41_20]
MKMQKTAYRGRIFYFRDASTFKTIPISKEIDKGFLEHSYCHFEDGVLIVDEQGKVANVGQYADMKKHLEGSQLVDYKSCLITPGFIDTHNHAAQSAIVAAYGEKLLEWLNNYVFPAESKYKNDTHAKNDLNFFIDLMLKNGTTTAVCYGPLFYAASNIFFEELQKRNMRFITGNTIMDDNSPDYLKLPTKENYDIAKKLIHKWHNKHRLSFCITPRFGLACSEEMLEMCGSLAKEYPDAYIQTHLGENTHEITAIKQRFPWSKHYLDVYDHYGLVTDRAVFGHGIHLTELELEVLKAKKSILAHCPTSNNFLGSGLFNFKRTSQYTNRITLGTDWGAGNTMSMLRVMDDAYKVAMLSGFKLPSMLRWYLATLGAARALHIDDKVGNFEKGKEADFTVIDPNATPILKYRNNQVDDIFELLFIIMSLADDRNIVATYIMGKPVYTNQAPVRGYYTSNLMAESFSGSIEQAANAEIK